MYDINKFIANRSLEHRDPEGYWSELAHWSPMVANRVATAEGLMLSEEHWQVIYCLRERFRMVGPDWTARRLTQQLEEDFAESGGRRYLYELFPRGPLAQGCRLAGLPMPHGTLNSSFGSVH
ncbi:MAG: TusE/DsrC/DsvC family sulfur relay protein [Pseudomonadota bacterium]